MNRWCRCLQNTERGHQFQNEINNFVIKRGTAGESAELSLAQVFGADLSFSNNLYFAIFGLPITLVCVKSCPVELNQGAQGIMKSWWS